jgi:hypothetical protein
MPLIDLQSNLSVYRPDKPTDVRDQLPYIKLGTVDYMNDKTSGATGFTLNMDKIPKAEKSQFLGINGNQYTPPLDSITVKPTANSKFNSPPIKLGNQLVSYVTTDKLNNPVKVNAIYNKFHNSGLNLLDASYNPSYPLARQPFILRGIQRKGNSEPQRWGIGGFIDDGIVRGGITVAVDRTLIDVKRISNWIASPRGILWTAKQVGLGLMNPLVEKSFSSTILGIQQTRIHTGIASLLSVAGSSNGSHITRYGIPFANGGATYENVVNSKKNSSNRLVGLKSELMSANKIASAISSIQRSLGFNGEIIASLSGIGGPNSLMGAGTTDIRRYTNTSTDSVDRSKKYNFEAKYSFSGNTYGDLVLSGQNVIGKGNSPIKSAASVIKASTSDTFYLNIKSTSTNSNKSNSSISSDGSITTKSIAVADLASAGTRKESYPDVNSYGIANYITTAYGKIPNSGTKGKINDFRNDLSDEKNELGIPTKAVIAGKGGKTQNNGKDYYSENNLEKRYGFGKLGIVGKDRSEPNKFIVSGNKFTGKKMDVLSANKDFVGDKITALDIADVDSPYIQGSREDLIDFFVEDGDKGKNLMAFRCTVNNFSDSFSPGWDKIDIMGRPDGAYLYTSFERNISFDFQVMALTRSEMIPMWRKLNYLASYTMPDFQRNGSRPGGPFMRITLGSLFRNTPAILTQLSYSVPEDISWDIGEDPLSTTIPKQLPMGVEVSIGFRIIGDYRPQLKGRVYSLSNNGSLDNGPHQWLSDSSNSK